jgi:trehalose 6-phosphate synthase/phosphatase
MLVSSHLPCINFHFNFHHKYLILLSPLVHFKDVEFGRLQARDMLQHLWTGPISNAAVDVVQGSQSVEVRPVGVTKVSGSIQLLILMDGFLHIFIFGFLQPFCFNLQGAAIDRILGEIAHSERMDTPIDYVLCIGHFLRKVILHQLMAMFLILVNLIA